MTDPQPVDQQQAGQQPSGPQLGVIVVAAGSGTRLDAGMPKAFVPIAGRPMLAHALAGVLGAGDDAAIVVVAPADALAHAGEIVSAAAGRASDRIVVVAGGAQRQASVAAGLAALPASVQTVLVHDAARALTPAVQFVRVAAEVVRTGDSVIPVLPVADTIKRVDAAGAALETVDRSSLGAVQTPQGFPRGPLEAAYASATDLHTDDAGLIAAAGGRVITISGSDDAFKITTPADLQRAVQRLDLTEGRSSVPELRTGVGVDVHAFDLGEPMWLGGVYWPNVPGLAGHSDGDAVCHAICDALLSAAGLGDIGGRFGTADPRFLDAHGDVFIAETVAVVTGAGWRIQNVAVQVIANEPRIGPRRHELEFRLGSLVGAPVSVAGTTTDHLGFAGRGEGLTAIATAMLAR